MLPCGLGSQAPEQGVCGGTRGVMTPSAPRRAEVGEGKPRGEGQMAPCWASLTLGRVVGTMGPAEAPLAPTRGARVRFPHRDGKWAGVRELTSPNLGHLQPREQLLLWRPPHWDGGPLTGDPGRQARRGEGLAQEIPLALILILPVMPLHCREWSAGRHGGAQHQLCTGGCEAIENQAPFV